MNLSDDEREHLIDMFTQIEFNETSPAVRVYLWSLRKALINERSPERVAQMERAKGLITQ